jgi:hypothetical protein
MALLSESLVLRGVSVRLDGFVVGLRLGRASKPERTTAMGNPNTTRHLPPAGPASQPACAPDVDYRIEGSTPGAGRSRRWSSQGRTQSSQALLGAAWGPQGR